MQPDVLAASAPQRASPGRADDDLRPGLDQGSLGQGPLLSRQQRAASRQWREQWQQLLKREAQATAELASCIQSGSLALGDLERDDVALHPGGVSSSAAARAALPDVPASCQQLQRKAWAHVAKVREAVAHVKAQLADVQTSPAYIQALAASIDAVDHLLSSYHAWAGPAITALSEQAAALVQEVAFLVLRIEEDGAVDAPAAPTTHPTACTAKPRPMSAPRRATQQLHAATTQRPTAGARARPSSGAARHAPGGLSPEVVAFEEFMLAHGEYGGWAREDHEAFETLLRAAGGDYAAAVRAAAETAIGFTQSDLIAHARWHMDYMDLLVKKRVAVAAWRAARDKLRTQQQAEQALLVPEPSSAPAVQAAAEAADAVRHAADQSHDTAVKKELVQSWKARRAEAVRAVAERMAASEAARAERQRIEWEERQYFNKMKLDLHNQAKKQREAAAAAQAAEQAEREHARAALSSEQVAAIERRSAEITSRRQSLLAQKEAARQRRALAQQSLLSKVAVSVPADPKRVLKGTAAHMARVQQQRQEEVQPRDSSFILHGVARRQQPSWRAGLQGMW